MFYSSRLLRQTQETKAIESRFAQLAQHAPIGICIYRADGYVSTYLNIQSKFLTLVPKRV